MAVRPIDAEKYMELLKEQYLHHKSMGNSQAAKAWQGAMQLLHDIPTLTPSNEPLTIEELQEMNGQPVYIISKAHTISEWNIPKGVGEIVIAYDVPCAGMKSVIPSVEFIDGKNLSVEKYGSDWIAYRRPPEGDEENE